MAATDGQPVRERPARNRDAVAALIAALIGVLALLVSGYTAYIQRQQVRAQVWPRLLLANFTSEGAMKMLNKGVGPAIVRSVEVAVDGRSQRGWKEVVSALGLHPSPLRTSTISDYVISANEQVPVVVFADAGRFREFRDASRGRMTIDICYCSTLDDCWTYRDRMDDSRPAVAPVGACPAVVAGHRFDD